MVDTVGGILTEAALAEYQEPKTPGAAFELETEETLVSANPELVLDMLGREPTQVILGGPGTGKRTILHHAMLQVCQTDVGRSDIATCSPAGRARSPS